MSRTILFECAPRRPADGVAVTQRYAFKARGPANYLGVQWEPVVETPPTFISAIGFDGREFASAPNPQVGQLVFTVTDRTRAAASMVWKNAAITIRMASWRPNGSNPVTGDFSTIWTGFAESISIANGVATVTMVDAGQSLRAPVITTKFGSSGDSLLDSADALRDRPAGTVVPQAWGRVLSIPGLLIDRTNNIWLFANSAATSVQAFYDGGAPFTLGVARASLATLQGNVPARGAVDYCLSAGGKLLARPWDVPAFPFTADAIFGSSNRIADIAGTIVSGRSGPAFKAGVVAAFNTVMAADAGLYLDDESEISAVLDRLFAGVGAWWKLTAAGTIDIRRIGFATPALTVARHRRGAPERQRIVVPTGRRSLGYARNNKVHNEGDIAAIVLAEDLTYGDGTTIEALKPGDAGATRNAVTYAAIEPSSPVNGDLWVDTSAAYAVFKLRTGGAWQTGANALTAYTALSGRPVALADINTTESAKLASVDPNATVGENLIRNAGLIAVAAPWQISGNTTRQGGTGATDAGFLRLAAGAAGFAQPNSALPIALGGAAKVYVSGKLFSTATGGFHYLRFLWLKSDGTASATPQTDVILLPATTGVVSDLSATVMPPADAAQYTILLIGNVTGGFSDVANLRIASTQLAADVTALTQVVVTVPARVDYSATSAGVIIGSLLPDSVRVSRGGTSIKLADGTSYAITVFGGIAASINNTNGSSTKGDITLSSFTGQTGSIDVVVTVDGVVQPKQTIQYVKTNAPITSTGGAGAKLASTTPTSALSLTTDAVLAGPMTVTIASGESLYGTALLDYEIAGTGGASRTASLKWQYDAGGGTWTDFVASTYVFGSAAVQGLYSGFPEYDFIDPSPGYVALTQAKGGLSAGNYPVRVVGKLSAAGLSVSFYGAATIEAKV